MTSLVPLVGRVVAGWVWSVIVFTLMALWGARRVGRSWRSQTFPCAWPPIWILRPCEGDEPGLFENLSSSLREYAGTRRVLFLVPAASDASCAVAQTVVDAANAGAAPGSTVAEVVITDVPPSTGNRKSAQLAIGLARAVAARRDHAGGAPEVIVQVDSDVRLDDRSLPALIGALGDDRRVAASFACPVELDALTVGDTASSGLLSASTQDFLVLAGLARLMRGVVSLAGACAAHRIEPLVEMGGFGSLEGLLGEDFEVGRRLHRRGYAVAVSAEPARCVDQGRSWSSVVSRTARWQMVVRSQRPGLIGTYPMFLAATPLALLLATATAALGGGALALGLAVALVVVRVGLAMRLRRMHGAPVGPWRALLLEAAAEVLMLAAMAQALRRRQVVWRGRRLRIGRGGVIEVAQSDGDAVAGGPGRSYGSPS